MPITASDKGGSDFEPIPAGTHHAVCYGVVDLGTQPSNNPNFADSRKVCILWEIPHERADFPDKNDQNKKVNRPRAISSLYTLSLGEKANLRKMLESWRAKPFTREELSGFDVSKLVGVNCMLSIIHKPGTGQNASKVYANVSTVTSLPKGMTKVQLENEPLYFSFSDIPPGEAVTFPANMPEWLKAKIAQAHEFKDEPQHPAPAQDGNGHNSDLDEDVPF